MTAPARFWHRYAAWSLDAALIGLVSLPFVAHRMATAARTLDSDLLALLTDFYRQLAAALGDAATPSTQALLSLAHDAAIGRGMAAVQTDVLHLAGPPLLAFAAIGAAYHVVGEASRWQAGPGKRALGLRVVDAEGQALSPGRALARHLAAALSWLSLNIGHLMAAAAPRHRSLHDRLTATRVVADTQAPLPAWARVWIGLQAVAALAATVALAAHWSGLMQTALERALG